MGSLSTHSWTPASSSRSSTPIRSREGDDKSSNPSRRIQIVDGTHAETQGYIQAPLRLQERTYTHAFAILPSLRKVMLIGRSVKPTRTKHRLTTTRASPITPSGMTDSLAARTEEGERLHAFLDRGAGSGAGSGTTQIPGGYRAYAIGRAPDPPETPDDDQTKVPAT